MARKQNSILTDDLKNDLAIIVLGAIIMIAFVQSNVLGRVFPILALFYPVASFLAGIFFTSAFTLAPAAIILAKLAESGPATSIALWGGLGAMLGDMVIFLFIRDRFADHLRAAFKNSKVARAFFKGFHFGFMKWLSPVLGALIIASPLPDEFGLALMGISKMKLMILLPIAFVMNFIGVWALVSFANFL